MNSEEQTMDTFQIQDVVRSFDLRGDFKGVFALNQLPLVYARHVPYGMIINTEPSDRNGSHWVAMCRRSTTEPVYYFDSYGLPPSMYPNIFRVMLFYADQYRFNRRRIQSFNSAVCGQHCIYFLYCLLRLKEDFDDFIQRYSVSDFAANDRKVFRFVHSIG
jgi:hypothetical protein